MSNQWFLKVYDNFHYQDEGETYKLGPYLSASDAVSAARGLVDASLRKEKRHSQSVEQLLRRYKSFGEDPTVLGPGDHAFSAWTYAESRAAQIFAEAPGEDDDD
jgi:hypothetical protein